MDPVLNFKTNINSKDFVSQDKIFINLNEQDQKINILAKDQLMKWGDLPDDYCYQEVDLNTIVTLPQTDFSKHTDLVVFKDSVDHQLPLNGIRQSEFEEYNRLYEAIMTNQTKIKLEEFPEFKSVLSQAIATILSRSLGRQLIKNILTSSSCQTINIVPSLGKTEVTYPETGKPSIHLNIKNEAKAIVQLSNGQRFIVQRPLSVVLFHELTHLDEKTKKLSYSGSSDPILHKTYTNLEEQVTITGFVYPPGFQDKNDDWSAFNYDPLYYSINENNFAASLRLEGVRVSHKGVTPVEEASDPHSKEVKDYIQQCVKLGLIHEIKKWIKKGFKINEGTDEKTSLIGLAISYQHPEMVEFLLSFCDLQEVHSQEGTPLFFALNQKPVLKKVIQCFLRSPNYSINFIKDAKGSIINPVFYSLSKGVEIFKLFLEKHPNVNEINEKGLTLIEEAASQMIFSKDILLLLLEKGAVLSSKFFHNIIRHHQLELIQLLFNKKFDELSDDGFTVLQSFIKGFEFTSYEESEQYEEAFQLVIFLVEHGINLNKQNKEGQTILHTLISDKFVPDSIKQDWISYLVSKGANLSVKDRKSVDIWDLCNQLSKKHLLSSLPRELRNKPK